jgi:hypothetical protein
MSDNPAAKQQKENTSPAEQTEKYGLTADQLEVGKKWLQLVAQARADKTLMLGLMDTPVVVLREHGINVRQGLDIRVVENKVVENTDKVIYLMLPPEGAELTVTDLDRIVGGGVPDWLRSVGPITTYAPGHCPGQNA